MHHVQTLHSKPLSLNGIHGCEGVDEDAKKTVNKLNFQDNIIKLQKYNKVCYSNTQDSLYLSFSDLFLFCIF